MAEPLKYMFNENVIKKIAHSIGSVYKPFDSPSFVSCVLNDNWDNLELKDRMIHISRSLHDYLPENFEESIFILKQISEQFDGFVHMFFPGFVEIYLLDI
jgi:hypothetical protein